MEVGYDVYVTNPKSGETELKNIFQTFEKEVNEIVQISVNGEVIETTEEHLFYIDERGFTKAVRS
ncbi:polymorphic toxin-type HINT domain-containing protein [Haloplasma contractile]|uniref:polymorphic toxin-type HINT domain-containing protein n=1 Tax=Haloplasma contractile TaxID=471825 RepID=UPI000A067FD0